MDDGFNTVSSSPRQVVNESVFAMSSTASIADPLSHLFLQPQEGDEEYWEDESFYCLALPLNETAQEDSVPVQPMATEKILGPFLSPLIEQSTAGFVEIDPMDNPFECLSPIRPIQGNVKPVISRINFASAKTGNFLLLWATRGNVN